MEHSKVKIGTSINAKIEKVWECWTQPEHITQWNFASEDWYCPQAKNDVRVGGKYVARMEAKDGSFGFDFEAVYDEVTEHKKVTYTMGDGRVATTIFESLNGSTRLSTTFDAETENDVEMQRSGWQAILDNFKKYTEAH